MRSSVPRPIVSTVAMLAFAVVFVAIRAYATEKEGEAGKTQVTKTDTEAAKTAVRAAVDSYVAAYNRGDAAAVADHWSETGEWTSPTGERFKGRAAIQRELRKLFAENKGVQIEVVNPVIRLVSPDVAIEEGTVRVLRAGEAPDESTYLAVQVKKGEHWKLDSVRETETPQAASSESPLQDLGWLVGRWGDQSPEATGAVKVAWTKNKAFLTYSFKISAPGVDDLEGIQVIGWDPTARMIRSWMFDSDGGFGEGIWTRHDNTWVVKFTQTLPDGRKATATNVYTQLDNDTFTWKSIGRKVGNDFLPNVEDVKMVRKTDRK